jgi:hypothetical protein
MPPKKQAAASEEDDVLRKARFGRVKNNLKMGMVSELKIRLDFSHIIFF